jgi:hypothetical protein
MSLEFPAAGPLEPDSPLPEATLLAIITPAEERLVERLIADAMAQQGVVALELVLIDQPVAVFDKALLCPVGIGGHSPTQPMMETSMHPAHSQIPPRLLWPLGRDHCTRVVAALTITSQEASHA